MAGQKFFHGLTDAMINRATPDRPDRQKSNFFWPDEYLQDAQETYQTSSRRQSTASSTPTQKCASPASEFDTTEVLRQRHSKNARSHIEFYDDCDSSFSHLERERVREKLRIEKFLREQNDDVSEAAKECRRSAMKSSFQFYDVEEATDGRATPKAASKSTNGYYSAAATPEHEEPPRFSPVSNGGGAYRRQLSPASSEHHYSARYTGSYDDFEDDRSYKSNDFNYSSFSPPGTPSGSGDVPEHKRFSQRHLRSSINFCNGVASADDSSAPRKPASVRETATERVGVGLPNL